MISPEREAELRNKLAGGTAAYFTPWQRVERVILYVLVAAALIGAFVLVSVRQTANGAEASLRLFCPAWHDVASAVIPPPTTPVSGVPFSVQIVADARLAYQGAHCDQTKTGSLTPADPRVAAYLKSIGH